MTVIRGIPGAVDDVGAAWPNFVEDDRAQLWDAHGGKQGIIRGFELTLDNGTLSVTFSAGSALIEERGSDITGNGRGYYVFNDTDTVVTFEAPDASARNDALVIAWADPQYGSLGASTDGPGPQIIVVKGTSGSTTPRTDSDINTAVGVGGWFRFADVIIEPADSEINPANVTLADAKVSIVSDAWVDHTPDLNNTTWGGGATRVGRYKKIGTTVHYMFHIVPTGSTFTGSPSVILPFPTVNLGGPAAQYIGHMFASVAGTPNWRFGMIRATANGNTTTACSWGSSQAGDMNAWNDTFPASIGNFNYIQGQITYETGA